MERKCESCGMPLSSDPRGGGTESDGTLSRRWCSRCYENGRFRHPELSGTDFRAHCMALMRKSGMPRILAWLLSRGIPDPPRWKK